MNKELLMAGLALADTDEGLITRFYEILFERHPAVRPMFSADVRPQAAMLRVAVIAVLDHLDDPAWLTSTLGALGAKHATYGATPEMFDAVAECLVAAMAERGGAAWTPEMTAAWSEALGVVAGLMLAGYPAPQPV
ncbi:globin domain-containing protein [Nocardioides sp. URHA0020]|uniref:globin domain-containing protein n=1 Tax=Nocardioides sp. URHA0020 TaxID=1380392 RepID=UPI00048E98D0|nr:globin domain-containing protein [Nocardioides sp. URHA0020]